MKSIITLIRMKKIVCIMLAVCLTNIVPISAASEEEKSVEDYSVLLNRIGINAVSNNEAYISRGDFTALVLSALKKPVLSGDCGFEDTDEKYNDYVYSAKEHGLIQGSSDGNFKPYSAISFVEAAAICKRGLGYESITSQGEIIRGIPDKNLFSGVSNKSELTCSDASRLIFNMLKSNYIKEESFLKNGDIIYAESKNTYLYDYYGVYHITGRVECSAGIALNGIDEAKREYIVIDSRLYNDKYYKDYKLLGRKMQFYIRETEEKENDLLYISKDFSDTVRINSRNISEVSGFDRDDSEASKKRPLIKYDNGKSAKLKEAAIQNDATIILNGERVVSISNSDFKKIPAEIVITDGSSNSEYDVIFVNQYVYYQVSSVDYSFEKIYDKAGKESIDINKFDTDFIHIYQDGTEADTKSIAKGAILQVMCNYNESGSIDYDKHMEITVLAKTLSGTVTMLSDDKFYIDDKEYYALPEAAKKISLGKTYNFYLGLDDLIVAVDDGLKDGVAQYYGYLVDRAKNEKMLNDEYKYQIYTTEDKMIYPRLAEKIKYSGLLNGKYVTNRTLKSEKVFGLIEPRQLVMYDLDTDGNISAIEIAIDHTNDIDYDGYDDQRFSLEYSNRHGYTDSNQLSENYTAANETIYFYVNSTSMAKEDFAVGDFRKFGTEVNEDANIKVYDADRTMRPAAVVATDYNMRFSKQVSYFDNEYPALITGKRIELDEEGTKRVVYTAYYMSGPVNLIATDDSLEPLNDIYSFKANSDSEELYTNIKNFSELDKGDMIIYKMTPQGKVWQFLVVNEYDKTHKNEYFRHEMEGSELQPHTQYVNRSLGRVTKFTPNSSFRLDIRPERIYNYSFQGIFYYIYDRERDSIEITRDISYLDNNDYVFVYSQWNRIKLVVLYL